MSILYVVFLSGLNLVNFDIFANLSYKLLVIAAGVFKGGCWITIIVGGRGRGETVGSQVMLHIGYPGVLRFTLKVMCLSSPTLPHLSLFAK